jgi:hypothetical protein
MAHRVEAVRVLLGGFLVIARMRWWQIHGRCTEKRPRYETKGHRSLSVDDDILINIEKKERNYENLNPIIY